MRMPMATLILVPAMLGACAVEETPSAPADSEVPGETSDTSQLPAKFAGTAWRSLAEDGARYTTYLDQDGQYRDLRNGDAYQAGTWAYATGERGGELCFDPEGENTKSTCWRPDRMKDDMLIVRGPGDRRIQLERVDYIIPDAGTNAETEADDADAP